MNKLVIAVSIGIALLLPLLLTPWKIPQIGQIDIEVGNYDFSTECWQTNRSFFESELPQSGIAFSPLWSSPRRGFRIVNSPTTWGDTLDPQRGVPRIVKAGLRIVGRGSVYTLLLCKKGEIAWGVLALEFLLPLLGGGAVLIVRRFRQSGRPTRA